MLTFLFGCAVGVAGMVCKNRIARFKNKVAKVINDEMNQKP